MTLVYNVQKSILTEKNFFLKNWKNIAKDEFSKWLSNFSFTFDQGLNLAKSKVARFSNLQKHM